VRLSSWVPLLSNLASIQISDCKWLQHIPPLDQFPFLKHLLLNNLTELKYISNDGSDMSSSPLKILRVINLPKLKGWQKTREVVIVEHHLPLFSSFPCLSHLRINNCPIISLALGSKTTPSSSSPFFDLSKLKYIFLKKLEQLEYLPLEWLQNLTSLKTLKIQKCFKMRISMSPLFQHLTSLENLSILHCKELIRNENKDGAHCLGPIRFCHLSVVGIPNLVSLPRELKDVTTLQGLQIMDYPSLVSLPEWIGDLTSLVPIYYHCRKVCAALILYIVSQLQSVLAWRKDVNKERERIERRLLTSQTFVMAVMVIVKSGTQAKFANILRYLGLQLDNNLSSSCCSSLFYFVRLLIYNLFDFIYKKNLWFFV
jgi:hypothetical protein